VNPIWWHRSPVLDPTDWVAGWTDDQGPDFRGPAAGAAQRAAVSVLTGETGLAEAAWVEQVHAGDVLYAGAPGCVGRADALWTDVPGLGVVGRSADCPLILVGGRRPDGSPVAGFAHASWRSTVAGITPQLVAALREAGAEIPTLAAQIAPSAGPCCYEVGEEVREQAVAGLGAGVAPFFSASPGRHEGRWIFDLWSTNLTLLLGAGLQPGRIRTAGICTICGTGYPSYRRDAAAAGRFAAMIGSRGTDPD